MRRFNPTKKEIEESLSQAQTHLSEARQAVRDDQFPAALEAVAEAEKEAERCSDLISERWRAIDEHREELIEYHIQELQRLRNAPDAVNDFGPTLKAVE